MPHKLLVDIGNSRVKWVFVTHGQPCWEQVGSCRHNEFASMLGDDRIDQVYLASVAPAAVTESMVELLSDKASRITHIKTGDPAGKIAPAYHGLGVDRWLALQAVWQASRGACVIADCGSALTVDRLDDHGTHRGGWITAGLSAARAGLAKAAPALPEPATVEDAIAAARGTREQISRGLLLQQAAMTERAWRMSCLELNRPLHLWLTGGDGPRVQSILDVPSQYDDTLVLKGLATLLK